MFRRVLPVAACALAIGASSCDTSTAPENSSNQSAITSSFQKRVVPGAYVVVLRGSVPTNDIETVARQLAFRHKGTIDQVFKRAIRGFSIEISAASVKSLAADPRVLRIDQDVFTAARPIAGSRRAGNGQETSYGVSRVGGVHDGTGRRVWIIDSGIDFKHADLNVNQSLSASFVRKSNTADDQNGHGTHVAGIVGAKNNSIGTVGVAANATLISVRVLDKRGEGQASWIIAGVEHVLANAQPGDVANLSLGGGYLPELDDAVRRLAETGVKVAIAAGNDGADCSFSSPASVSHANVYTVSAIDDFDVFWMYSNYGYGVVDYAAPGVEILSSRKGGGVVSMSGTSMATPHVAGLLAVGSLRSDGRFAVNDYDGQPDPIAIY